MEGLTEEQVAERDAAARAADDAGNEPRVDHTEYVVQKQGENPGMWLDIDTVVVPRKAPRKNALSVALEAMGADPATGGNPDAEGSYRVIPMSIAKPLVVRVQTTQAAVIE